MAKKNPGTAVATNDEFLREFGAEAAAQAVAGGNVFSIQGGQLTFGGVNVPGNSAVVVVLDAVVDHLTTCDWTPEGVDPRGVIDGLGLKARKVMPALYAAVEGRHAGLPLFDSIALLGRDRTLARLRAARARLP